MPVTASSRAASQSSLSAGMCALHPPIEADRPKCQAWSIERGALSIAAPAHMNHRPNAAMADLVAGAARRDITITTTLQRCPDRHHDLGWETDAAAERRVDRRRRVCRARAGARLAPGFG